MGSKAYPLLFLAVVFGLVAAWLVRSVMTNPTPASTAVAPPSDTRPVAVASADLLAGAGLTNFNVSVVELPVDAVPAGAFASVADALADNPIALTAIAAREVLLPGKLSTGISRRILTSRIPDGERAITIPVNVIRGVGGFVLPGDRVDILVTTAAASGQPLTYTILQDMSVLGVDQLSAQPDEGDAIVVSAVTLLADPDEAKVLTLAQRIGDLTLMLRNEGDATSDVSANATLEDLWEYDLETIQNTIQEIFPAEQNLEITTANGRVIIGGEVSSEEARSALIDGVRVFAANDAIVDLTQISDPAPDRVIVATVQIIRGREIESVDFEELR